MNVPTSSSFLATDGDAYEFQMGRWSRRLAPLLIDFAGINHASRVLDVGCGTGNVRVALPAIPASAASAALICSPAYIEHAKRGNNDARLHFEVADACALPFANAHFDHSLSMLALQFTPDISLALREMRRVTRPGGTVAAATWDTRGGFVAFRIIFDAAAMLDSLRACRAGACLHASFESARRTGTCVARGRLNRCGAGSCAPSVWTSPLLWTSGRRRRAPRGQSPSLWARLTAVRGRSCATQFDRPISMVRRMELVLTQQQLGW